MVSSNSERVLITGATGMLGVTLVRHLIEQGHDVKTHGNICEADYRADLTNKHIAKEIVANSGATVVINLVGLTNVDECELDVGKAYMINTKVVENLVAAIRQNDRNCHLIQISTDQVYDGDGLFTEDSVSIRNNYALTKYAGEISSLCINSTILRVNFFGRSKVCGRSSLTDWIYDSLLNDRKIKIFEDVSFSPLSMETLSEKIGLVIGSKLTGVYNLGSRDGMTKADFARNFARLLRLPMDSMESGSIESMNSLKAYRPRNMRMNCAKFENEFGVVLPTLISEIEKVANEYV